MNTNLRSFENRDIKSFFTLLSGSILSKILFALGSIFLAKIYGASDFGIFNTFLSFVILYPVLTSLNLENVIIKLKSPREVRNTHNFALSISLILSTILTLILACLMDLSLALRNYSLVFFLLCLLGGILTSWSYIQSVLLTKYRFFKQISIATLIGTSFSLTFQVLFYFYGHTTELGLIYGWLLGTFFAFIYYILISKFNFKGFDFKIFRKNVKDNLAILTFAYPSDAINTIANNLLPILTLAFFSSTEVGTFALASKLITLPLTFFSSAISKVYFQKSIRLQENSRMQLLNLTTDIAKISITIVAIYIIALNTIGIYFLEKLFSRSEWNNLPSYLLILSPWVISRALVNPISQVLFTINKNHFSLIFNIYLVVVNILAVYIGVYFGDYKSCLIFFSIGSALGYLAIFFKIFITLRGNGIEQ